MARQPTTTLPLEEWHRVCLIGKAASTDTGRPVLCAIRLEVANGTLTAVATDSYKLAKTTTNGAGTWALNVPAIEAFESHALFAKTAKRRALVDPQVRLYPTLTRLDISLMDGKVTLASVSLPHVEHKHGYPNWRPLIDEPGEKQPASRFAKKSRAQIVAYLEGQGVRRLKVEASRQRLLEAVDEVYGETSDTNVAFNLKQLDSLIASSLRTSLDHPVRVRMYGSYRPIYVSVPSDPRWLGVLMPVRI